MNRSMIGRFNVLSPHTERSVIVFPTVIRLIAFIYFTPLNTHKHRERNNLCYWVNIVVTLRYWVNIVVTLRYWVNIYVNIRHSPLNHACCECPKIHTTKYSLDKNEHQPAVPSAYWFYFNLHIQTTCEISFLWFNC